MKTYTVGLLNLTNRVIPIGYEGENLYTQVRINCEEIFRDYPSATAGIAIQGPDGEVYPAAVTKTGNDIVWTITSSFLSEKGAGLGQLTFVDNETVIKSEIFHFVVYNSLIADGEMPDPVEDWITEANNKLGEVEAAVEQIPETIDEALAEAKASGEFDGEDGFSPVVSVTEITDGHRVSVTDAEGTETFDVMNGEPGQPGQPGAPGQPGVSPTVTVTDITGGHRITVTDATGPHSFDVMDGEPGEPGDPTELIDDTSTTATDRTWSAKKTNDEVSDLKSAIDGVEESIAPVETSTTATAAHAVGELFICNDTLMVALSAIAVGDTITTTGATPNAAITSLSAKMIKDVQVNGTSVLSQGVANVPYATTSDYGVVKIGDGLKNSATNKLAINSAGSSTVKGGTASSNPIVPEHQHESTFYGLAKAAGADMKNSSNPVGTYTESAKSAISQMLDAPETVSGTTPSITAKPGVRYVCGECATLTIVAPASGCIDVTFTSGSTATVLTVSSAKTGVTAIKWANGFDPTSLDANTRYEILIDDGEWGMVASWT